MTDEHFVSRSRTAFLERFPRLAQTDAGEEAQSSIVFEKGKAIDIVLGDRRIYGDDAQEITICQLKDFFEQPLRLVIQDFGNAGLATPLCAKMISRLLGVIREADLQMPAEQSTFLVVLGLGLGHHLTELVRTTGARWVIIVEPFSGFIEHSHHVVDWPEIFELIEQREGDIYFVTDLDPSQMTGAIARYMRKHGTPYIDGTWIFTHYPLWAFAEARKRLLGAAANMFAQCGFFEDEIVMTANAAVNFSSHPFWLINAERRHQRPETAVVVGAGPSLDEAIEKLREIRDRVVIFSAGTALRPLLRNGIIPDFHCELENGPQVLEVLQEAAKHGDLSQIKLIASASIEPGVLRLFGDQFLFFREISSPTAFFRGEFKSIRLGVPTCVNTALCVASFLGFTNFLLFGTDCGVRPGRPDHAVDTVYRDVWKMSPDIAATYPLEVEGNFGGIAMTNWVYDSCRRMLVEAIAAYGLSVINCSDGALIPGTTPKVPEAVEVGGDPIDRERLFADLKNALIAFQPGEILRSFDVTAIAKKNRALYKDLRQLIDRFDPDEPDFAGVYAAFSTFEETAGEKYAHTHLIGEGTVVALPRIAMYSGSRIADPVLRRRLYKIFLDYLRVSFDEMERDTEDLFESLRKQIEGCVDTARTPLAVDEAIAS